MLTEKQLKKALHEHFEAERARDVDWIVNTAADGVEYYVVGPHYPDDPVRAKATAEGKQALRELWVKYFSKFSNNSWSSILSSKPSFMLLLEWTFLSKS